MKGFSPRCLSMCTLRPLDVVHENSHCMQVKGFFPECFSMCILRLAACVHLYSHWMQLNGFSPVWKRMWIFKLAGQVNEEAHIGHLWVFSPPFFVLVWDVRRIVKLTVSFRYLVLPMKIFLCFSFTCLVSEIWVNWRKISKFEKKIVLKSEICNFHFRDNFHFFYDLNIEWDRSKEYLHCTGAFKLYWPVGRR